MNEISKGGLALAKHIASAYLDDPSIKVIIVGGSVSRGCADSYSDLEIGVFWAELPSPDKRQAVIEQVGGELWSFDRSPGNEHYGLNEVTLGDRHFSGTAMISSQHLTVTDMETCLSGVIDHYDTSLDKQVLISAIQHGFPLYGAEVLQRWQAKANTYPDQLALKIIQENLWFGPWFCPEAYAGRDDRLVLYQHFIWIEQGLLKVLAGLNRIYYPSAEHKWMDHLIAEMRFVPLNLSSRMKQVFQMDLLEGWYQLKELIDETLALVEAQMPEVETASLFQGHPEVNLTWAKERWKTYTPYTLLQNIATSRPNAI